MRILPFPNYSGNIVQFYTIHVIDVIIFLGL